MKSRLPVWFVNLSVAIPFIVKYSTRHSAGLSGHFMFLAKIRKNHMQDMFLIGKSLRKMENSGIL